ncbi:hypothetical protein PI124_g18026 [Phytophthora idaei]|nr:hypothetical protein PI124_g18026 [Phytophthora idaei]
MRADTSEFVKVLVLAVLVLSGRLLRRIFTSVLTLFDADRIISGRRVYIGYCIAKGGCIAVDAGMVNPDGIVKGGCIAVGDCMVDPDCIVKGGCIAEALFCRATVALEPAMREGWVADTMAGEYGV